MSIATSIEKLSETLTNCKANLKEKEVADVDNIKISDVDEKIAEIKSGLSFRNMDPSKFSVKDGKGNAIEFGDLIDTEDTSISIEVETTFNEDNLKITLVNGLLGEKTEKNTKDHKVTFESIDTIGSLTQTPLLIWALPDDERPISKCFGFLFFLVGTRM